jgi:hypothetical protein
VPAGDTFEDVMYGSESKLGDNDDNEGRKVMRTRRESAKTK